MKSLFESKTFWANAAVTLVGVLSVVAGNEQVKAHPQIVGFIVTAIGVVNVILRVITEQPVTVSAKKPRR